MHARSADLERQGWVSGDQQQQSAHPTERRQPVRNTLAVGGAKVAENDRRAAGKVLANSNRIRCAFGISQKKERWNCRCAGLPVEPACLRR